MIPRSGDVLTIGREASVQFATPILFRVIRVHDWTTYDGWVWIDGYQLNTAGDAIERRSIFVQIDGLRPVGSTRKPPPSNVRPLVGGQRTGEVVDRRLAAQRMLAVTKNNSR